ncbi:zinc ribbon domain-containing protein, partial [Streptomyces sp. ID05-39B]|nr:zinc ribbon domain-containing protein [Streptomyces sp. ID05-39B]
MMSQIPRQAALPTCPSCAEPLDTGDRFCGACGYDLSAVPPRPDDTPTLTMNGAEVSAAHGAHASAPHGADGPPPSP